MPPNPKQLDLLPPIKVVWSVGIQGPAHAVKPGEQFSLCHMAPVGKWLPAEEWDRHCSTCEALLNNLPTEDQ